MNANPEVSLRDCLEEIKNALNYWYPTTATADEDERNARHVRLFQFRDRLEVAVERIKLTDLCPCQTVKRKENMGTEKTVERAERGTDSCPAPCRGSTSPAVEVLYAVEWRERGRWKRAVARQDNITAAKAHACMIGARSSRVVEITTTERVV